MWFLLPAVHGLLVLLPSLKQEAIDYAYVIDVTVSLELLADTLSDEHGCDIEAIEGDDLGCLERREGAGQLRG